MIKLCYILPKYDSKDATHFAHIHDFLKVVGKRTSLFLIIEKGNYPDPSLGYNSAVIMRAHNGIIRFFETLIHLIRIRLKGYRTFYIHYSFGAACQAEFQ